jgi:hypothetical protein
MEKKKYSYKRAVQRIFNYLVEALDQGKSLQRISEGLRNIVNSYEGLNRNERYRIYSDAYASARAVRHSKDPVKKLREKQYFEKISTGARVAKSRSNLRKKKQAIRLQLQDEDQIFFICSQHEKPAKDHADYQGKIYVDEKWRSIIVNKEVQMQVEKYINAHNVKSLQWVTNRPVWFITRPNCRHYFKVMDTEEVLKTSRTKLLDKYESSKLSKGSNPPKTIADVRGLSRYISIISSYDNSICFSLMSW